MRLRSIVSLLAATAVIASSCGGVPDDVVEPRAAIATTTRPTTVVSPGRASGATNIPLTDSFRGVTSSAITIAVVSVDFDRLRDMFGVDLDYQDPEPVMQPLIDDLNLRGGINGRRVEVVYRKFLPVGAADADRVCIEVTEDIGVFAVLGGFVGPGAQEVNLCLTRLHDTILIGLPGTARQHAESTAPWIVDGMSQLRKARALVTLLADAGRLAKRVAIWASNADLYPLVPEVADALEQAGAEVVFSARQSAAASDLIASDDEYRLILERAVTEDVAAVYWLGNGLSPPKLHASNAPGIAIYDPFDDQIEGILRDVPDVEDITVYSAGIFPKPFRDDPILSRCIDIVEEAGDIRVERPEDTLPGEPDWYQDVITNCSQLRIFEMAAEAAGPDLTNDSFLAAAESLGEVGLPGKVAASIRPGKHDVADAVGLAVFDATAHGKGDFVPIGPIMVFDR